MLVAFSFAVFFFYLPEENFGAHMPFIECLMLGLAIATVDTMATCIDTTKTMALFVNIFILMLIQYLNNPGDWHNEGTATQIVVMIMQQTAVPIIITLVFSIIAIVPLRMKLSNYVFEKGHEHVNEDEHEHEKEEEEEIETEFDYVLMLAVPLTAFLVGESLESCGFVPLVFICIALRWYAKPNLTKERAVFLRLLTGWTSGFSKKIAYTLMGVSLPLHFKHENTSYLLAIATIVALPLLTCFFYFILCRIFKKKSIIQYYRVGSDVGIISYMLALLTFDFRIMHFVLTVNAISHLFTDNLFLLVTKCCCKMNDGAWNMEEDNIGKSKFVKQLVNTHEYMKALFIIPD